MVTSDRISAFDVVMDEPIPHKGRVLTAMSAFWFGLLDCVVPGHLVSTDLNDLPPAVQKVAGEADLAGQVMLTRRADMLPVECIVRGYITGSAWKEYRSAGTMHGACCPRACSSPTACPSPCSPVDQGRRGRQGREHLLRRRGRLIGESLAAKVRDVCLSLYRGAPTGPASGASSSPTRSSSWGWSRASWCCATRC